MMDLNTPWVAKKIDPFSVEIVDSKGKDILWMLEGEVCQSMLTAVNYHGELLEAIEQLLVYGDHDSRDKASSLLSKLKEGW